MKRASIEEDLAIGRVSRSERGGPAPASWIFRLATTRYRWGAPVWRRRFCLPTWPI